MGHSGPLTRSAARRRGCAGTPPRTRAHRRRSRPVVAGGHGLRRGAGPRGARPRQRRRGRSHLHAALPSPVSGSTAARTGRRPTAAVDSRHTGGCRLHRRPTAARGQRSLATSAAGASRRAHARLTRLVGARRLTLAIPPGSARGARRFGGAGLTRPRRGAHAILGGCGRRAVWQSRRLRVGSAAGQRATCGATAAVPTARSLPAAPLQLPLIHVAGHRGTADSRLSLTT
mmetsp:Transcript_2848/g.9646  ORF Transcript_2848/g.9646 Transcript_2848/m.9646 type:complete len:230 (+) Transcript_2848:257-946(+)